MGRILDRWTRVYVDGVNLSGYGRSIAPLGISMAPADVTAGMGDTAHGFLPNRGEFSAPTLNCVMDDTATSGSHAVLTANSSSGARHILKAYGDGAAPAIGSFTYSAVHRQAQLEATNDGGAITINAKFGGLDTAYAQALLYLQGWGRLLHPYGTENAVNAANTNVNNGAASTKGGIFVYHIYSITGAGTVTLSIDESATGVGAWGALTGATSGAIATATAPTAGYVQLATNANVKQYLRWQIAFGGAAVSCYFVTAFIRGL